MKIILNGKAKKELKCLPKHDIEKLLDKIFLLGGNNSGLDIKKIQPGHLGFYRLRVGNYRVIFKYGKNVVEIFKIDTRQSIYDTI
ncbi:MAG: type II toxin-antitoxin system RelE/ParE family toxin [Candidatus Absconditabacterales bacterium]